MVCPLVWHGTCSVLTLLFPTCSSQSTPSEQVAPSTKLRSCSPMTTCTSGLPLCLSYLQRSAEPPAWSQCLWVQSTWEIEWWGKLDRKKERTTAGLAGSISTSFFGAVPCTTQEQLSSKRGTAMTLQHLRRPCIRSIYSIWGWIGRRGQFDMYDDIEEWGRTVLSQQYKDHSAHGSRARVICSGPVLRGREMYINFVAHLRYSYLLCMLPTAIQRGYSCLRQEEKKSLQTETAGWTSLVILMNLVSPMCLLGAYLFSICLQKAVKSEQERWSCSQRGSTYSLKSSSSIFLKQCLMMQSVVLKEILLLLPPFFPLGREEGAYSLYWGRLLEEGIWSPSMQREVRTVSWSQSNRDRSAVASPCLPNCRGSNSSASCVFGSERQESTIECAVAACMRCSACWESSCMF